MTRCSALALAIVIATVASALGDPRPTTLTPDELLRDAMRFPVVSVPLSDKLPTIDGQVDDAEWSTAAMLPNFISMGARRHEGTAQPYRTRVWMQYDADALYIAMRAEYPQWIEGPTVVSAKRDLTTGHECHFDLFINPRGIVEVGEFWHLCGNANGALFDRHLANAGLGLAWSPAVEYKARVIPHGWEGEYKLPFAALEIDAPKKGDYWRANLFFIQTRPGMMMSTWSPWGDWRQTQGGTGYGWLRFGSDGTAVRFENGVEQADREKSRLTVIGAAGAGVEASVELYKRTDPFAAEHPSMIMNLARWHNERNEGGAAFIGADVKLLTAEVLKRFTPVVQPIVTTLQPGDAAGTIELPATPELGEYLVRYQFARKTGAATEVLAAGVIPYRVRPQMDMDLRPMLLGANVLHATVDYANLRDLARAKKLDLSVKPAGGSATVFEASRDITGSEPITFTIPGDKLPAGKYLVHATVRDGSASVVAEMDSNFERPASPAWWTNPVGSEPVVPRPWTRVEAKQSDSGVTVSMWGREYTFTGLPVPAVVKTTPTRYSTGEPAQEPVALLGAPMTFHVRAGGQPVSLQSDAMRITAQDDEKVVIESASSAGDLSIQGVTTVEFDGLIRVDLVIAPKTGSSKVDGLDFVIPFKSEYAQLLGNFNNAPGPGKKTSRYLGKLPELPWTYPVFFAQTIGTDRLGLQWICDSTRDWRMKKPDEAAVIRREGSNIEEVFRLIDYQVEIKEPLRITFGLIALPVKPLPDRWGTLRITSSSFAPPSPDDAKAVTAYEQRAKLLKPSIELHHNPSWSGTPWYPYPFQDKAAEDLFRREMDLAHKVGVRYAPHSGWQAISTLIPEWSTFGKEMAIAPETETIGKTVFACYNSPYSEFTASLWEHHIKTVGIDGIKPDTMFPQTWCNSLDHGCGWYDERGRLWPSVNLFATRQFMKRLYRMLHGGVKQDGITSGAQTGVPIAPICSFTDIVMISEGTPYHKAASLREGYSQDLVRALMVGAPYGVITVHDLKGGPLNAAQRIAALLVAGADPRFMVAPGQYLRGYAKRPPHDFDYTSPAGEIWAAWDWIDRGGKAVWMPHWENEKVLSIAPVKISTGETALTYGSMLVQPGQRILLILANYEKESITTRTTLDLKALGFAADAGVYADDAVTGVPMNISGGVVDVGVLSERYRLVRIWAGDEPPYSEKNLGPDLFTGGDFESFPTADVKIQVPLNQKDPAASRDDRKASKGAFSVRLDKKTTDWRNGADSAQVIFNPVTLEPGDYVLEGSILIEKTFDVPTENGTPRQNSATADAFVSGAGVTFDPPAFASAFAGRFMAEEQTPGWDRFLIAFKVENAATPVTVSLHLGGIGSVWFDDLSLRRVAVQK